MHTGSRSRDRGKGGKDRLLLMCVNSFEFVLQCIVVHVPCCSAFPTCEDFDAIGPLIFQMCPMACVPRLETSRIAVAAPEERTVEAAANRRRADFENRACPQAAAGQNTLCTVNGKSTSTSF